MNGCFALRSGLSRNGMVIGGLCDVSPYGTEWPVRQPSLLHAGYILKKPELIELYKSFEADPTTFEVLRNLPIRHPLLWVDLIEALDPNITALE